MSGVTSWWCYTGESYRYDKLFDHLWYSILAAEDLILCQEIRIWGTIINSL